MVVSCIKPVPVGVKVAVYVVPLPEKLLFNEQVIQEEFYQEKLTHVIDEINNKNGRDTINWGSSMIEKEWNPLRDKLSSIKTTTIENIPTIFAK